LLKSIRIVKTRSKLSQLFSKSKKLASTFRDR
jgi:hypothetical protein